MSSPETTKPSAPSQNSSTHVGRGKGCKNDWVWQQSECLVHQLRSILGCLSACFVLFCFVLFCFGLVWFGLVWFGWIGVVWCNVVWCGVAWRGLAWFGVVWSGLVRSSLRHLSQNTSSHVSHHFCPSSFTLALAAPPTVLAVIASGLGTPHGSCKHHL